MSSFLSSTNNYSAYALPAAWVCSIVPHIIASKIYDANRAKGTPAWNVAAPRQQSSAEQIKIAQLPKHIADMYHRAEAAQQNGFENLAFFAVALLAGNAAKLPTAYLNGFAALYIASRVAFNASYILTTDPKKANIRSLLYLVGVISNCTVFIKACTVFQKSVL